MNEVLLTGMITPPEEIREVGAQVVVNDFTGEMEHGTRRTRSCTFNYDKARRMRRDAVLRLARAVALAIPQLSPWTIEADADWEWLRQFMEDEIMPLRSYLLRTTIGGMIDFGWKAYEKIFEYCDSTEYTTLAEYGDVVPPVLTCLDKLKGLKNDYTWARYNRYTGEFLGLSHMDQNLARKLYIDAPHSLFINFDEEGLGEYGEADMETAEDHYDAWDDCNAAAKRYDRKIAGSFLTVKYRVGKTKYLDGTSKDNSGIADEIIRLMQSNGAVAIPCEPQRLQAGANAAANWDELWKLEFLSAPSQAADFTQRLMYLDKMKARSIKVTERSIFEGEFGTKADSESHFDAMLLLHHVRHQGVCEQYNNHVLDQLAVANAGPEAEGCVRIVAHEMSDKNRKLFTDIFTLLAQDPGKAIEMIEQIDDKEIMKSLEIPLKEINELNNQPTTAQGADWRDDIFEPGVDTNDPPAQVVPWWASDVKDLNPIAVDENGDEGDDLLLADDYTTQENVDEGALDQADKPKKPRKKKADGSMPDPGEDDAVELSWHPSNTLITPSLILSDDSHEYSCIMAMLPDSFRDHVTELQLRIDRRDLVKLETEPHITVKYGLHTDDPMAVQKVLGDSSPVKFQIMGMGCFENEDKDVLYAEVWSECLRKLNAKVVGALEFTDDNAVYNPHMTIAYLKPGTAKKYEGWKDLQGLEVILNKVVFSDKSGKYTDIMLNGSSGYTEAGMRI